MNPWYYVKADPFVRKEALKSLFLLSGAISTTLGLLKLNGVTVGTDIRSSDFGKVRVGNTRIDIMGGFQQYIRSAGQIYHGEYVSSTTGKKLTLGEGYKPLTRADILVKQVEAKLSPAASFVWGIMKQQDAMGEKFNVPKELADRFTPMVLGDMAEMAKQDPSLLPLSILGVFGMGIQTYPNRPAKSSMAIKGIGGLEGLGNIR